MCVMGFDTWTGLDSFNDFMLNISRTLWDYQRYLLEHPNPNDPLWFLVDLDAPRPE